MIAAAALVLLLGQSVAATPQTPVAPVAVTAPGAAPEDPVAIARNLAVTYDQGCGGRIYGMYADACNNLAAQLRKAQAAARRYQRKHPEGR